MTASCSGTCRVQFPPERITIDRKNVFANMGSSNIFTNKDDANLAKIQLKSQDWVDTCTTYASHRRRFWMDMGSLHRLHEKLDHRNLSMIYLYVYCHKQQHKSYIPSVYMWSWDKWNGWRQNNLNASIMYIYMFTIIVSYRCRNNAINISVCNSYICLFLLLRLTTSGQVYMATKWVA